MAQPRKAGETRLKDRGRLNVRASGTEKLVRIMAEGPEQTEIEEIANDIATVIEKKYGQIAD